ncbi:DEAD/DEAH box helicase [Ceratobasidium sp. AG-Ba]|nr:DEAD/DEAH box helicase [Ceratobasidium sp. AG-Ba]
MKSHTLQLPNVTCRQFLGLEDTEWKSYVQLKQPMFVFCHSGPGIDSVNENDTLAYARILLQRTFMRNILMSRIAISLINEAKYVDSKVLSFVYERQRLGTARSHQPENWDATATIAENLCTSRFNILVPGWNNSSSPGSRESWLTNVVCLVIGDGADAMDQAAAFIFLASQIALSYLSIQQRAQTTCVIDRTLRKYLVSKFYPKIFGYLAISLQDASFFPDLDGNIFLMLLNAMIGSTKPQLETLFGPALSHQIETLWLSGHSALPDMAALSCFESIVPVTTSAQNFFYQLLYFSHPILDPYLKTVFFEGAKIPEDPNTPRTRIEELCDIPFTDTKHWHNSKSILPKHLGGADDTEDGRLTSWERMKRLRREQRFMSNMQRHAQTLTGAKGTPINRIVISEAGKGSLVNHDSIAPKNACNSTPSTSAKKSLAQNKKAKVPQLSSSDKLKAKIAADKQVKKTSEDEIWWLSQLKLLESMGSLFERKRCVDSMLRGKRCEKGWLRVEVLLYQIHLMLLTWISANDNEDQAVRLDRTVTLLHATHTLRDCPDLFPTAALLVKDVLCALGFHMFSPPAAKVQEDRELSFKFIKVLKRKSGTRIYEYIGITESPIDFQLKAYGVYMDRSMDSRPDRRVTFEPDGWQRQVLDNVDRNISTLVVAPTSAGKTFSCFYAMEKVLREGNDGIIVYVSPTKALCQQIAADIYARFSKKMKGKTVWAIHNRDFQVHDPLKTQILVTVPDILSIMLLSPAYARVWTPHLKWIILDEIHSIGQLEGGQVWEHIILLSTCPILGLSATIGQPEAFSEWLQSVQEAHHQPYAIVEHKYRYSHLRKFAWQMPKLSSSDRHSFNGLHLPPVGDDHMPVIHPMEALLLGGQTIPPDLALEAQDCLSLYRMLETCVSDGSLSHLAPDVYFMNKTADFLKQSDVIEYETALKSVVFTWMREPNAGQKDSYYEKLLSKIENHRRQNGMAITPQDAHPPSVAQGRFIELLHKLHVRGDLPCLAFNFDRSGCERYVKTLVSVMKNSEERWRESTPHWAEKIKQWELWKSNSKARERETQRLSRQNRTLDTPEYEPSSWQNTFDPNDPAPEFSFANSVSGYSKEELEKDIKSLRRQKTPEYLISALKRGIAIHHAGLPKSYRSLVEGYNFFSSRLPFGINAPAKTAIFLEDSPYLTALMYRQCAGRAGRRGFDLLGNVIFYNFPIDRVYRLMLSRLPPLTGNWPLTTTLCLRLFNLLTGSNQAQSAVSAIDSFMRLPRLSVSSEESRDEVLHHMRFSIDFLQRSRLLTSEGLPTALFGIVGHLYYEEPGNLAFTTLFRRGIIHRLCSGFKTSRADTEKGVICLVATLFARRPMPYFSADKEVLADRRAAFGSVIRLPELPRYVLEGLDYHNKEVLQVYVAYATAFAGRYLDEVPDDKLPLSNQIFGSPGPQLMGSFSSVIEISRIKDRVACSAFVANSGHNDSFASVALYNWLHPDIVVEQQNMSYRVADLGRSARSGLHLNVQSTPYFDYTRPTNAYAYDYWQHESVRPLCEANGIREGEIWFALQSFYLVLATLTASLRVVLVDKNMPEEAVEASDEMEEVDEEKLQMEVDKAELEEDTGEQIAAVNRPAGIHDEDWLVFETFQSVTSTFYQKWEKMWA